MKSSEILSVLSYGYQADYQDYEIAQNLMKAQFSQHILPFQQRKSLNIKKPNRLKTFHQFDINQIEDLQLLCENLKPSSVVGRPDNFHYAHFTIPLFKYPVPTLGTIFVPIWILNLINIGIFFSSPKLSDRLSSVATLMIAYVALIPTVRQRIPKNSKPTFVQILVYFQALISMLSILQGIDQIDEPSKPFIWYEDVYFLAVLLTASFSFFSIVILYMIHKCYWQPNYNKKCQQKVLKFNRKKWFNQQCDNQFTKFKQRIQILDDPYDVLSFKEKFCSQQYNVQKQFQINKNSSLTDKLLQ